MSFEVFADGRKIHDETVGLGESLELDLDVTDVLRLKVSAQEVDGDDDSFTRTPAVWGKIRLTGLPDEVPDLSAEE